MIEITLFEFIELYLHSDGGLFSFLRIEWDGFIIQEGGESISDLFIQFFEDRMTVFLEGQPHESNIRYSEIDSIVVDFIEGEENALSDYVNIYMPKNDVLKPEGINEVSEL